MLKYREKRIFINIQVFIYIYNENQIKTEIRKRVAYNTRLSLQRGASCGGQCFHGNNAACRADINFTRIDSEVIIHSCRNCTTKFYAIRFPIFKNLE